MLVFLGAASPTGSAGIAGIAGDYLDEAPPGESSGGKRGLCGSGGGGYR